MARPKGTIVFDPARFTDAICAWLEEGKPLEDWCAEEGRPSPQLVRQWKREIPAFGVAYARAREEGGMVLAERMRKTAATPSDHPDDVAHRRLMIDTDKWLLARWFPTQFGDKQQHEHAGSVAVTVVTGVPEASEPKKP